MTNRKTTQFDFAQFASQMARNPHTLARFHEAMKDVERKQQISARIVALRERRGLTQPQVARRIGAELRTYQNWEAGGGTSGENYERLAEVLGCSYDYLVMGAEAAPPPEDILARLDGLEARVDALLEHHGVTWMADPAAPAEELAEKSDSKKSAPARKRQRSA